MSTEAILAAAESAGLIVRFTPLLDKHQAEKRRLYLSRQVDAWVHQKSTSRKEIDFKANVRVLLGDFVKGGKIDNKDYIKWLSPKERDIWEIKIRFSPTTRILGGFIGPNCFLCTNQRIRGDMDNAIPGGRRGWDSAMALADTRWNELVPQLPRLRGRTFADLVTFNGEQINAHSFIPGGHFR